MGKASTIGSKISREDGESVLLSWGGMSTTDRKEDEVGE